MAVKSKRILLITIKQPYSNPLLVKAAFAAGLPVYRIGL